MPTVERSVVIQVSPEQVWEAYVGLDGWLQWNGHMKEVKLLEGGELDVGKRARVTLKTRMSSEWEVTELTPGKSFTWVSRLAPGLRLAFAHEVEAADGGTRAVLRIDSSGPVAVLAAPVLGLFYSRNLAHALDSLKALLEEAGGAEA
jgi:uncharacterized protein YndB with AHSA1/START domain